MDKTAIIIPARYASTRLEGKPLIKVNGKSIIEWVYTRAKSVKSADEVIVATDDKRIFDEVKSFGGDVEMTSVNHKCGSDRIKEVASRHDNFRFIINLQGDEPTIKPENIELVINGVKNSNADISTLIYPIEKIQDVDNPNLVKCVIDNNGYAMYFSRSKIPFERHDNPAPFYGHIGIYGYTRDALFNMTEASQTTCEIAESLEQLRALQMGMKIKASIVTDKPVGIDTKEDLEKFKLIMGNNKL